MMRNVLALWVLFIGLQPAAASLPRDVLATVAAKPVAGARLPLNLTAVDTSGTMRRMADVLQGRPAFVNFVDYTCNTLCGTDLMLLADGIKRARLNPKDYRILVIGIDPKDGAKDALAMEGAELPPDLQKNAVFLLPNQAVVNRATNALGYSYAYDAATDQFAHPAVVYAVGPQGELRATLTPLALTAGDLRRALAPGRPSFIQRVAALCYGYDPQTGAYDLKVARLLQLGAAVTLAVLAFALFRLTFRRKVAG